jgi:tRNA(fMet)-specific endonuclease VapC
LSYILDSNTWIALLRRQDRGVLENLKTHPASETLLCSMVLAELWYGAEHSGATFKAANYALVDDIESKYASLPFDNKAAREYAVIREQLSKIGQPIGPNDTIIAAIARSNSCTLVTHNTTEFGRVPGLQVEDWQTPKV